jgi:hypothetical protein
MSKVLFKSTLYEERRDDIYISIDLTVTPSRVEVFDYSCGRTVDEIWGDTDYEFLYAVTKGGARKILDANGIVVEGSPTVCLGRYLDKTLKGDNGAATSFQKIALAAGVEPESWSYC